MRAAPVLVLALAACSDRTPKAPPEPPPAPPAPRTGIDPDRWTCDVLTTPAVMSATLGAPTREVSNGMPTPRGVPRPCTYVVEVAPGQEEAWSYDLDCRDSAEKTAEILFRQYQDDNTARVAAYQDAAGGKPIYDDAGDALPAPGDAFEVAVGKRGLDHHGQGILFVDDDTPCYARVVGRDPARRLALAKLLADKLRPATAPMRPRLAP